MITVSPLFLPFPPSFSSTNNPQRHAWASSTIGRLDRKLTHVYVKTLILSKAGGNQGTNPGYSARETGDESSIHRSL